MPTARRLYLYAVAWISLETVLWGIIGLLRSIISGAEINAGAVRLAGGLSLILVGVPVFLIHWFLAQRAIVQDPLERYTRIRGLFLYGALLTTLIPVMQNLLSLIDRLLLSAMRLPTDMQLFGGNQSLADNLIAIAANLIAAAYLWVVVRGDWRLSAPGRDHAGARRIFQHIWLVYGLGLTVAGLQMAVEFLLSDPVSVGTGTPARLAHSLTLLIGGLPLWIFVTRLLNKALSQPGEALAGARITTLLALAWLGALISVISGAAGLEAVIQALLNWPVNWQLLLVEISTPVSILLPAAAVWVYYALTLNHSLLPPSGAAANPAADPQGETKAALKRLYRTALAMIGLVTTYVGAYSLVGYLVDLLTRNAEAWIGFSRLLSAALAALVWGLPVWLGYWLPLQAEAESEGEAGERARSSPLRKAYLYIVVFGGIIGVMFGSGAMLYQLLLAVLGNPPENLAAAAGMQARTLFISAVVLAYHGARLRSDGLKSGKALQRRRAKFTVLALSPDELTETGEPPEESFTGRLLHALERSAAGVPVAVHSCGQGVPDETLSTASLAVMPAEILQNPPESLQLWLQTFNGRRMVIPTNSPGWDWVAGQPPETLYHLAAENIRRLADGDAPSAGREHSPFQILVYVLAGLFALELIFALVITVVSFFMNMGG